MHNKRLMKLAKQQSQRKQELYNNFQQTFISTINLIYVWQVHFTKEHLSAW